MRILAVDTSSERGSVCVADGKEVLGEVRLSSSIQHSERLFRSIEFLFQYLPFQLNAVELFVAARGPGSFTGLRVGLAAIEGFVMAFHAKGGGISTLEALAWKIGRDCWIAPTIDAHRGEVYGALYSKEGDELIERLPPAVLKPSHWFESLPDRPIVFCGEGAARYWNSVPAREDWAFQKMDPYLASAMAEMAQSPQCGPLEPLYVRKTDAEIARERRYESTPSSNP